MARRHVAVKQLVEDFARYLYLPRLAGPEVLVQAIRDGVALLTWRADTFAYAEGYDEAARATADCTAATGSTSRPTARAFSSSPTWRASNSTPRLHPLVRPLPCLAPVVGSRLPAAGVGETPPAPPVPSSSGASTARCGSIPPAWVAMRVASPMR